LFDSLGREFQPRPKPESGDDIEIARKSKGPVEINAPVIGASLSLAD
jgi:hypothetical protein